MAARKRREDEVIWEYWVERHCTHADADRLGAEGWELVALRDASLGMPEGWFKRRVQ